MLEETYKESGQNVQGNTDTLFSYLDPTTRSNTFYPRNALGSYRKKEAGGGEGGGKEAQ